FVIAGPSPADVIDRYTQLTGRPRFPPLAAFGLGLSDKANDENSPDPSDERWWKREVAAHRAAGFPLDHLINDNRWRAGGGKRCESFFAWDTTRFPDPAEYERWVREQGLFVTIDFNRCIASKSDGWRRSFNIPVTAGIDYGESAPDFTREEVRGWFWKLHWHQSLDPALAYPGDALWIDEFDELGPAPDTMVLGNGRTWREMKNYWFFLIAQALVAEGWDRTLAPAKRPFVWVRGMTAGAQRYATLWSGDIRPTWDEMREAVRGMQLAGLSGFPFWGHDAGGFYDWQEKRGPTEPMYQRWSMAMGSFSPFWKPHGMGESRWPLDRSPASQEAARTYARLRYALLPYTYTCAREASTTGMPIARAMLLAYPHEPAAWSHDLQYMWGREILVAPCCSDSDTMRVWLPAGTWYDYWTDGRTPGGRVTQAASPGWRMPLYVKEGAIIPMAPPALSSAFLRRDSMIVHVYAGREGTFTLYEDDGTSEAYRQGEFRTTLITYAEKSHTLTLNRGSGTYAGAPGRRFVRAVFHGIGGGASASVNGERTPLVHDGKRITVNAGTHPVTSSLTIRIAGTSH
ncbi:MAG TPA: TIM-barrel domain-containing protein, partial [Bacteroidota bacterium]|nr:TIM-barrel domain-containing protein [Bacteroidota bacterium]